VKNPPALGTNEMVKPPNIFGFGTTMMLDTASDPNGTDLSGGPNEFAPCARSGHFRLRHRNVRDNTGFLVVDGLAN
jgi:hypothetical protein